jgi:hypothetical protein
MAKFAPVGTRSYLLNGEATLPSRKRKTDNVASEKQDNNNPAASSTSNSSDHDGINTIMKAVTTNEGTSIKKSRHSPIVDSKGVNYTTHLPTDVLAACFSYLNFDHFPMLELIDHRWRHAVALTPRYGLGIQPSVVVGLPIIISPHHGV